MDNIDFFKINYKKIFHLEYFIYFYFEIENFKNLFNNGFLIRKLCIKYLIHNDQNNL